MLAIGPLRESDVPIIADAFARIGWSKPVAQYERYFEEAARGARSVSVATWSEQFCGYVTIKWIADYPPFQSAGIPEVQDLNVLPAFRCRGIGTRLMDEVERLAAKRGKEVGLGVALDPDYGPAQRLYAKRGYVPDGCGAMWNGARVKWGDSVRVDDDLVIYLTKSLAGA